jgi:hypothetical protein
VIYPASLKQKNKLLTYNPRTQLRVKVICSCKIISLYVFTQNMMMPYSKPKLVHVAGIYSTKSSVVFDGCGACLLYWTIFLLERRHCECCVGKNRPSLLREYCTTHKYDICLEVEDLLEAFAELRKATVRLVTSVRPHGKYRLPLVGYLLNLYIWALIENISGKIKFY